MTQQAAKPVRFGSSWSTQFRLTQAIGRRLAALTPVEATVHVIGPGGLSALANDKIDLCFLKSANNEHHYTGKGLFAGSAPDSWLRTIAWLPQEDRFLFAVAPWTGIESFEGIAAKKPALKMQGRSSPYVLKEYGFSYEDIVIWGGSVGSMDHTSTAAKAAYDRGELDAFFGDGSAHDFTAWDWVASRGYKFLDISEEVMQRLASQGIRRNTTPSGFLPGINKTLNAVDDSHIVLTCSEKLDDEVAYNLAKAVDLNKQEIELESIQLAYGPDASRIVTQLNRWSSLTDPIERQWDESILGAPLHPGAKRYYQEIGVL
ncbi:MAG: hypothetical protein O3B65_04765 [Chloroflexi bacterium]|nr:hypothetical protein [Chloroflexota bacterium]